MLDAERERVKEYFTYVECLLLITPERLSVFWSSTPQVSCDTWRFIMNLLLTSENMPTNKRINKSCLQKNSLNLIMPVRHTQKSKQPMMLLNILNCWSFLERTRVSFKFPIGPCIYKQESILLSLQNKFVIFSVQKTHLSHFHSTAN